MYTFRRKHDRGDRIIACPQYVGSTCLVITGPGFFFLIFHFSFYHLFYGFVTVLLLITLSGSGGSVWKTRHGQSSKFVRSEDGASIGARRLWLTYIRGQDYTSSHSRSVFVLVVGIASIATAVQYSFRNITPLTHDDLTGYLLPDD